MYIICTAETVVQMTMGSRGSSPVMSSYFYQWCRW